MEPSEFLSREQFEQLSDEEATAYMEQVDRETEEAMGTREGHESDTGLHRALDRPRRLNTLS